MSAAKARGVPFRVPVTASLAFHAAVIAAFLALRPAAPPGVPPVYRVTMVAAPPGERAIGVVQPKPAEAPPTVSPVRPKTPPKPMPDRVKTAHKPAPTPVRAATPMPAAPDQPKTPPSTVAPTAGGGDVGGHGADVANVNTGGIDFPFPGYLENIERQIALRFKPTSRGALRAEVAFMIRRDGTVLPNSIRLVTRSNVYSFDLDAQGAVEAAAQARAFGSLPAAFPDDVLPVVFRFDPRLIH